MVNKILENIYTAGLNIFAIGDKFAVQSPALWKIYKVIKEVPPTLVVTSAEKEGYIKLLQEIDPLKYNVVSDKNPTPEHGAEVPGVTWYNYQTGETFILQNKLIEDKYVWVSDKGTMVCADTSRILDYFGDGSAKFLYEFNGTTNDTGGLYNLKTKKDMIYVPGLVGKCAQFASKNYCYTDVDFENPVGVVSIWAKPQKPYGNEGCLFHLSRNGDNHFSIWNSKVRNEWYIILNNKSYFPKVKIEWNKWVHLVLNTDGDFYVNGKKVYSANVTVDLTKVALPMLIGADRDSSTSINDWYKGFVEEVRFFNKLRTDEEIKQLYNELSKYVQE